MRKRGQTTLFVIIGIVLLVLLIPVYTFLTSSSRGELPMPSDVQEVKLLVDSCLLDSVKESVVVVAGQGGMVTQTTYAVALDKGYVVVWLNNGQSLSPTQSMMEDAVASAVVSHLESCLDFSLLQAYTITAGSPRVKITFYDDLVGASLSLPLTIIKNRIESRIEEPFEVSVPSPLLSQYVKAVDLVAQEAEYGGKIDLIGLMDDVFDIRVVAHEGFLIYSIQQEELLLRFATRWE